MTKHIRIVASETISAGQLALNFGISYQLAAYYRKRHGMPKSTNGCYQTQAVVDWLRNERGWQIEVI
ncbi:hypothetical protein [Paracoccus shanxieyensis]|uniref:DNA-binding protein n=1 Tax=Paracoccus shanxieyensis TaxID=2675752 RepID=A0A6L6J1Z9_9RHOB|nr:hypothetical protein [Paracoccus shanxieyensis]MTH64727.1 hypothetical protein [Paracoccus shanxieyensis]MTH87871.1 hypothetical protein [Paracoccus shanxieyensis]